MTPNAESEMLTYKKGSVESETMEEGPKLKYAYYRFSVEFPLLIPLQELTDEEILTLADKTGTFDFLYSPQEDVYNPSDGTPI